MTVSHWAFSKQNLSLTSPKFKQIGYSKFHITSSLANQTCIWSDKLTIQYPKELCNTGSTIINCYSNVAGCKVPVFNSGIGSTKHHKLDTNDSTYTCGIYNTVHVVYDAYQHKFPLHS